MIVHDCTQGTPEWWMLRRGIPTASEFSRILTPKTMKLSSSADGYIYELIADSYRTAAPIAADKYTSRAMQNGIDLEPEARNWYALECGQDIRQVGFVTTDDGLLGCSPDGLVGDAGGLELKCPDLKTHVGYLLAGTLPDEYRAQVHGNLLVTGREWWDFVSYAQDLPPFRIRVTTDDYTAALTPALKDFTDRLRKAKERIQSLKGA